MISKKNQSSLAILLIVSSFNAVLLSQEVNQNSFSRSSQYSQSLTCRILNESRLFSKKIFSTAAVAIFNHPKLCLGLGAASLFIGCVAAQKYYREHNLKVCGIRPTEEFVRRNQVPVLQSVQAYPQSNFITGINGSVSVVEDPERYLKDLDDESKQYGLLGHVTSGNPHARSELALVPFPGAKIPCKMKLADSLCAMPHIDKTKAQKALEEFCLQYPLARYVNELLRKGEPVRSLITGETGYGKNFLAYILAQEAGSNVESFNIPILFLLSKWHNCQYAGIRDILFQAEAINRSSGKKIILILDSMENLESDGYGPCCGVPHVPGVVALCEFFDRQESGEGVTRSISILGLTTHLGKLSDVIKRRFFQPLCLELPNERMRTVIIRSALQNNDYRFDRGVRGQVKNFASMTDGLTARDIEQIFTRAMLSSYSGETTPGIITWPLIWAAHEHTPRWSREMNLYLAADYRKELQAEHN